MTSVASSPNLRVAENVEIGGLAIPLFGAANLWIEDGLRDTGSQDLVQTCIRLALEGTTPGQVEVLVYDESLTGIASAFEALNSGGERILRTCNDQAEFVDMLRVLRDHVQGVNSTMQKLADTLPDFRRAVDFPVEGYKLVVVATDISLLPDEVQNGIATLLKAGPRAGVSFLIHSTTIGANPFLVQLCDKYTTKDGVASGPGGTSSRGAAAADARALIASAKGVAAAIAQTKLDPVSFESLHGDEGWGRSSADGVTFAVGLHGASAQEITLGDELNQRHNIVITGAVGQGKSNLLSVMVHSLCTRYSPKEVELYMLDFKEGVTLKRFLGSEGSGALPHVRSLGLDADREFGLRMLQHLFATYRERMRVFKAHDVQSIREFRAQDPTAVMPRIVLIIDEFQIMFAERDRLSDEIADLLLRSARLFRAAGIHLVLASQTLKGGLSLMGAGGDALFSQIPIRIALKNSLTESQATLGLRNDAAVYLRSREAIVNLDYGDISANRKTAIAYADEDRLRPRRARWAHDDSQARPLSVFDGEGRRSIEDDWTSVVALAKKSLLAPLGRTFSVDGRPFVSELDDNIGRNIAIVGAGDGVALIGSAVVALAAQLGERLRVVVLNFFAEGSTEREQLATALAVARQLGAEVDQVSSSDVPDAIRSLQEQLPPDGGAGGRVRLIVGAGLDRCRNMPQQFADLIRLGPPAGVHLLGWWTKFDGFKSHVGYGGEAYFDTRIALRADLQSIRSFLGFPTLEWSPRDNRALALDVTVGAAPEQIIPYTVLPSDSKSFAGVTKSGKRSA